LEVACVVDAGEDPVFLIASSAPEEGTDAAQVREFLSMIARRSPPARTRVMVELGPKLVGAAAFEEAMDELDLRRDGVDWWDVGITALEFCSAERRDSLFCIGLDTVLGWQDPARRAWALGRLARYVPRSAKEDLKRAVDAQDNQFHRHFIPLAGRLAELGFYDDALGFSRALPRPGSRARALCLVANQASPLLMTVAREALEVACADPGWHDRSKALSDAIDLVIAAPREESLALFEVTLHRLARRERPEFLMDLMPLVTWVNALGGSEAILAVIRAVHDVTAAWQ